MGGRPVPTDIVDRCLERIVRFVKLAVAVTGSEFPSFDHFAFQVFHLDKRDALLAGAPNGRGADKHEDTRVARHRDALRDQLKICAQRHKSITHCGYSLRCAHHVFRDIIYVLMRYVCFSIFIAAGERTTAKVAAYPYGDYQSIRLSRIATPAAEVLPASRPHARRASPWPRVARCGDKLSRWHRQHRHR